MEKARMPAMKIRHPVLIKLLGFVIAWVLKRWLGTLSFRSRSFVGNLEPAKNRHTRYLYSFWHEHMALIAYQYAGPHSRVLISDHADGKLITEVCRHLRLGVVNAGRSREGARALRRLLNLNRKFHLAVTPDGPRGPRRQVKPGMIYVASRTGVPIVPVGVGYQKAWRMRSWDRLALPCPGSLATCVIGEPITVPADADKETLGHYCLLVQKAMEHVSEVASRLAGEKPGKLREVAQREEPPQGGMDTLTREAA
jgi:lysophospholipid acyltransferase (LPLAT)-like uncharacterized protein